MDMWICVTNYENWLIIKSKRIWGVNDRWKKYIQRVKPGDLMIFYVIPKSIGGIFRVISEPYYDDTPIFYPVKIRKEKFPYRVRLEPVIVLKDPVDFSPLVEEVSFIKNKQRWSAPFRRAMFKIDEKDFNIIRKYLEGFEKDLAE